MVHGPSRSTPGVRGLMCSFLPSCLHMLPSPCAGSLLCSTLFATVVSGHPHVERPDLCDSSAWSYHYSIRSPFVAAIHADPSPTGCALNSVGDVRLAFWRPGDSNMAKTPHSNLTMFCFKWPNPIDAQSAFATSRD